MVWSDSSDWPVSLMVIKVSLELAPSICARDPVPGQDFGEEWSWNTAEAFMKTGL
jgi:hypothetical protein